MKVLGRTGEKVIMNSLLESDKAELLAMYGRRRIGKTFLIKNVYANNLSLEFSGTQNASLSNQLLKFYKKLLAYFPEQTGKIKKPKTWFEGFETLKTCLKFKTKKKQVVFFDELPWIASKRSGFLEEFAYWWNDWACHQPLVVVICGSAASWIIKKVINNKGGLHNRVTKRINLKPFTLAETKIYLKNLNVTWDHYDIIQFYMAVGGVPTYLNEARAGESVTQAINRLYFGDDQFMNSEFHNLYAALFEGYKNHITVIKTLASKWQGMNRVEIQKKSEIGDGGGLSTILTELEQSSFIQKIVDINKNKKDAVYRLCDEYSLFYLKFIDGNQAKDDWMKLGVSQAYKIWAGYAFENVCIKHISQIKSALGISGIHTDISSYIFKGNEQESGMQLDLIIKRADRAINICEMKFTTEEYMMTNSFADELRQRREKYRRLSKTRDVIFNTMISPYGIKHSSASLGQIDQVLKGEDLFNDQGL